MTISKLPQGEFILNSLGYKSTPQIANESLDSANSAYRKLKHFLGTPEGISTIENLYCYQRNPDFKKSANYAMSLKLYNELVEVSPDIMQSMSDRPCSEVKDMFCGIGGMLVYEFGTGAILSVISGGLVVGGTGTAGVTSVAGAGVAGITIIKAAGALLKLGKKSIELLLAAITYLKRFLPISTFNELLSYITKNLPTADKIKKFKEGVKKISLDDLIKPFVRERQATFGKLTPITPSRVKPAPRVKDLDLPESITQAEIDKIYGYSLGDYQDYNTILRGYPGAPKMFGDNLQKKFNELVKGLKKLPSHNSSTYRGTDFSPDELLKYKHAFDNKTSVSDTGFISTTKNQLRTTRYQNPGKNKTPVTMEIRGKNGKDISKISATGHEQEVLFLPGSEFNVVGYIKGENGIKLILEEI